jgi:hypothetical protein
MEMNRTGEWDPEWVRLNPWLESYLQSDFSTQQFYLTGLKRVGIAAEGTLGVVLIVSANPVGVGVGTALVANASSMAAGEASPKLDIVGREFNRGFGPYGPFVRGGVSALLSGLSPLLFEQEVTVWVVRGGSITPAKLIKGVGPHRTIPGLTGFSVQCKPGVSVPELAAELPGTYGKISVTTIEELEDLGYKVWIGTPGQGAYHSTVETPVPLPTSQAEKINQVFIVQRNPLKK